MILQELDQQLDPREATLLRDVLTDLDTRLDELLDGDLVGAWLTGSFALGAGDVHADVDFVVVTARPLAEAQEQGIRELHAMLADREEHWAHHLEGSYVVVDDLRQGAGTGGPWLYVDNGSREMEWSSHDDTEVSRWVLHHRALTIRGPRGAAVVDDVPPSVLRKEAADLAVARTRDIGADPDYLRNAWGQPHEVLTRCRMLVTATRAEVLGKEAAGRWCQGVLPGEWHDLIEGAIRDRPDPWQRVHRSADPDLAVRTWEFVQLMTPLIVEAAERGVPRG